jgi:hypothetical protein
VTARCTTGSLGSAWLDCLRSTEQGHQPRCYMQMLMRHNQLQLSDADYWHMCSTCIQWLPPGSLNTKQATSCVYSGERRLLFGSRECIRHCNGVCKHL